MKHLDYEKPISMAFRAQAESLLAGTVTGTETETPGGGSTDGPGYGGDGDGNDFG